MENNRIIWIDITKVIGMYLIILGHFYPYSLYCFIYSFSVPLFFFISGMLSAKMQESNIFISKLYSGLAKPYLLICFSCYILYICFTLLNPSIYGISFSNLHPIEATLNIVCGFHGYWDKSGFGMSFGCQTMWFVYTLLCCKLIYKYINCKYLKIGGGILSYSLSCIRPVQFSSYEWSDEYISSIPFFLFRY